jgi:hypothetical protein
MINRGRYVGIELTLLGDDVRLDGKPAMLFDTGQVDAQANLVALNLRDRFPMQ